jgi:hypothetical protein
VHTPYLAASVWLGFIFLLDPLNARAGAESILGDWHKGRTHRLVNLLVAGLVCGVIWELWNYWVGTKWIYNVPILPELKIFEMPVLGFGGFPPFAVECFTMYVTVPPALAWDLAPDCDLGRLPSFEEENSAKSSRFCWVLPGSTGFRRVRFGKVLRGPRRSTRSNTSRT